MVGAKLAQLLRIVTLCFKVGYLSIGLLGEKIFRFSPLRPVTILLTPTKSPPFRAGFRLPIR